MSRVFRFLALGGLGLLLLAPAVLAQSQATTGVIGGTIRDEAGAVMPGVTVTVSNTDTNFQRVLVTDGGGRFRGLLLRALSIRSGPFCQEG